MHRDAEWTPVPRTPGIEDPIDKAIREASRIVNTGPIHRRHAYRIRRLRWHWSLVDERPIIPAVIAEGNAWTGRRARLAAWRAYMAELDRIARERAEQRMADADGGCE